MIFDNMLFYGSVEDSKCFECPQKYNCVKYMTNSSYKKSNYGQKDLSNTQTFSSKSVLEGKTESPSTILSVDNVIKQINQDLNKQNEYLQSSLKNISEELATMKEEMAKIKNGSESSLIQTQLSNSSIEGEERQAIQVLDASDVEVIPANTETGLEVYNKETKVLREKKTLFGNKKWVEEKK